MRMSLQELKSPILTARPPKIPFLPMLEGQIRSQTLEWAKMQQLHITSSENLESLKCSGKVQGMAIKLTFQVDYFFLTWLAYACFDLIATCHDDLYDLQGCYNQNQTLGPKKDWTVDSQLTLVDRDVAWQPCMTNPSWMVPIISVLHICEFYLCSQNCSQKFWLNFLMSNRSVIHYLKHLYPQILAKQLDVNLHSHAILFVLFQQIIVFLKCVSMFTNLRLKTPPKAIFILKSCQKFSHWSAITHKRWQSCQIVKRNCRQTSTIEIGKLDLSRAMKHQLCGWT